jgi:hypothetical protein
VSAARQTYEKASEALLQLIQRVGETHGPKHYAKPCVRNAVAYGDPWCHVHEGLYRRGKHCLCGEEIQKEIVIARESGLSLTTISTVMHRGRVHPKVLARIEDACQRLASSHLRLIPGGKS